MTEDRSAQNADDQLEDLDVSADEAQDVKGGEANAPAARKAGEGQKDFLIVKLKEV